MFVLLDIHGPLIFFFNLLRSELLTKTIIFHAASGLLTGNPESVLPHRLQRKLGLFLLIAATS